jgi:hypothetical protein
MTRALKGLCFAGLGGAIAAAAAFIVVLSYSYELPTQGLVIGAVSVGSLLGFVTGALWGNVAVKWLLKALANL